MALANRIAVCRYDSEKSLSSGSSGHARPLGRSTRALRTVPFIATRRLWPFFESAMVIVLVRASTSRHRRLAWLAPAETTLQSHDERLSQALRESVAQRSLVVRPQVREAPTGFPQLRDSGDRVPLDQAEAVGRLEHAREQVTVTVPRRACPPREEAVEHAFHLRRCDLFEGTVSQSGHDTRGGESLGLPPALGRLSAGSFPRSLDRGHQSSSARTRARRAE
jgi:hypothetical protein